MQTTSVTIPAGQATGHYYLLAFSDASGAVAESNETNNQTASALQVTAGAAGTRDLVVSPFTAPSSAAAGATISVTDTTRNQGTADVTVSTWTRFYLSTTPTWSSSSIL